MTSRLAEMNKLERAARDRWLYGDYLAGIPPASHVRFGTCDGCGRIHDEEGRLLLVARRPRSREFLCLTCFEFPEDRARA